MTVACSGVGCGGSGPARERSATAPIVPPGQGQASADYEVHEWGLVRAEAGDVLRAGAVAPPRPVEVMAVDKPVLYFHAGGPLRLAEVSAHTPGGEVVETWPFTGSGPTVSWREVSVVPGACTPSPLPSASAPPCSLLPAGALCESAGLALVRTADAACVTVGGATDRFLFYRAEARSFTPPLRFARAAVHEDVTVTNDGELPIPGVIVRIWSDGVRTRTLVAAPPAPRASVVIGHDFGAGGRDDLAADNPVPADRRGAMDEATLDQPPVFEGPGRDGIRRSMTELGMAPSEIDAFLSAWDATLFGRATAVDGTVAVDVLSADGDPAPRETLLYFLPTATVDGIATVTFDPPPRVFRRAFAVWTTLRPSGESR
jgi:hypothetical protein